MARKIQVNNLRDENIIAVSDVHLGYRDKENKNIKCNKKEFNNFINSIKETECNRLVICGDFLDMWRRDPVGVILENVDTFNSLKELKESKNISINFVVGNHDFYLRHFKEGDYAYDFSFDRSIKITDANENREYWFLHGDKFDIIQNELFYDPLCLANDDVGQLAEMAWQIYLQGLSWWKKIWKIITRFGQNLVEPVKPAETRFETDLLSLICNQPSNSPEITKLLDLVKFPDVERNAIEWATNQEKLLTLTFGHTHKPFIHIEAGKSIANTGSWVNPTNPTPPNTYVKITEFQQTLWSFKDNKHKKILDTVTKEDGIPIKLVKPKVD